MMLLRVVIGNNFISYVIFLLALLAFRVFSLLSTHASEMTFDDIWRSKDRVKLYGTTLDRGPIRNLIS